LGRLAALLCLTIVGGCASPNTPPLEAMDRKVDLERFMGDWYVIGFIPVTLPFFSEASKPPTPSARALSTGRRNE
jgi:lipocalin